MYDCYRTYALQSGVRGKEGGLDHIVTMAKAKRERGPVSMMASVVEPQLWINEKMSSLILLLNHTRKKIGILVKILKNVAMFHVRP